jgi:hypothetical protein
VRVCDEDRHHHRGLAADSLPSVAEVASVSKRTTRLFYYVLALEIIPR